MVRRIEDQDNGGFPGYLFRTIDRIEVIAGAVVMAKKPTPPTTPLWTRTYSAIEKSGHPINWYYLSSYILQNRGPLDVAVAIMRKAVEEDPDSPVYRMRLADCLDRSGCFEEAVSEAKEAVRLAGDTGAAAAHYRDFLESLLKRQPEASNPV